MRSGKAKGMASATPALPSSRIRNPSAVSVSIFRDTQWLPATGGTMSTSETDHEPPEDAPPVLGTWRRLYAVVIAWLVVLIAIFYLFARRFAA